MAFKFADWVKETDSGTAIGTGAYQLNGAVQNYKTCVAVIGNGNTSIFSAADGTDEEVFVGTVTDGTPDTLSRDEILSSSNGGLAVSWGAGTRTIAAVTPAALFNGRNWVNLASSSTTDIGNQSSRFVNVTGTTTITALGTPGAGYPVVTVKFAASLTLTHNGTSLILPGGASITTAAGDVAMFKHEGSGNWRCVAYLRADGSAVSSKGVIAKTANHTVLTSERGATIDADATSAAFTITLPAAASAGSGFEITVKKTDSTANAVTIDADGSETIDGATTYVLRGQYEAIRLICDGTEWFVVAKTAPASSGSTSLSGTSVTFSGIPAGVKHILVSLSAASHDGTGGNQPINVQLGDSGGLETTGYVADVFSIATSGTSTLSSTSAFPLIVTVGAANDCYGHLHLTRLGGNVWAASWTVTIAGNVVGTGAGSKTLSAELDRLALVLPSGASFDAGSASILFW